MTDDSPGGVTNGSRNTCILPELSSLVKFGDCHLLFSSSPFPPGDCHLFLTLRGLVQRWVAGLRRIATGIAAISHWNHCTYCNTSAQCPLETCYPVASPIEPSPCELGSSPSFPPKCRNPPYDNGVPEINDAPYRFPNCCRICAESHIPRPSDAGQPTPLGCPRAMPANVSSSSAKPVAPTGTIA